MGFEGGRASGAAAARAGLPGAVDAVERPRTDTVAPVGWRLKSRLEGPRAAKSACADWARAGCEPAQAGFAASRRTPVAAASAARGLLAMPVTNGYIASTASSLQWSRGWQRLLDQAIDAAIAIRHTS